MKQAPNSTLIAKYLFSNVSGNFQVVEKGHVALEDPDQLRAVAFFTMVPFAFFMSNSLFGRTVLVGFLNQLNSGENVDYKQLNIDLPKVKDFKLLFYIGPKRNPYFISDVGWLTVTRLQERGTASIFCHFTEWLFKSVKNHEHQKGFLETIMGDHKLQEQLEYESIVLGRTKEPPESMMANIIVPTSNIYIDKFLSKL